MNLNKLFLLAGFFAFFNAAPPAQADSVVTSELTDRNSVELVVYNNNLGLVIETRKLDLPKGSGTLRFSEVPSSINPETVHVQSVNAPNDFQVIEQNYEHDLVNSNSLLQKYVGKQIKLVDWNKFQDRKETVEATLLSMNGPVYQVGEEIYIGHPGTKVLPALPEDLVLDPTLVWRFKSNAEKEHALEVTYLISNISWNADYVLVLDDSSVNSELSAWVTLRNSSGGAFENASLKLMAGDVNRVTPQYAPTMRMMKAVAMDAAESFAAAPAFNESQAFEYYRYDLNWPTTIKNNETKQVNFMKSDGVKVIKEYRVQGAQGWYGPQNGAQKPPVQVYLKFKNDEESELGRALPAGTIRVYQQDTKGAKQFVGESHVGHTPQNEEIEISVGSAFDLVAERKQTDYKRVSKQMHESEWEVVLKNRKSEAVVIELSEQLHGNWQILENSHPFTKDSAFNVKFNVKVPADSEVKVTYKAQLGI